MRRPRTSRHNQRDDTDSESKSLEDRHWSSGATRGLIHSVTTKRPLHPPVLATCQGGINSKGQVGIGRTSPRGENGISPISHFSARWAEHRKTLHNITRGAADTRAPSSLDERLGLRPEGLSELVRGTKSRRKSCRAKVRTPSILRRPQSAWVSQDSTHPTKITPPHCLPVKARCARAARPAGCRPFRSRAAARFEASRE